MGDVNSNALNFENSEVSFRGKSDRDLRQTHQLFKMMNNSTLVKVGKPMINLAFGMHLPIQGIIRNTIYKHFVGGISIQDSEKTIAKLAEHNVGTILDYAVEGEESEKLFDDTAAEVIRTIQYAHSHIKTVPYSAFKITGIGRFDLLVKVSDNAKLSETETEEYRRVLKRVDDIFRIGYELNVPILIDAEETWIQPMLDDLVMEMSRKYNKEMAVVQNTYQMYRVDSIERLKKHHEIAKSEGWHFGLKIVRGAYMEKERARALAMGYPSPIQPDKASTDRDFDDIIDYMVENRDTIHFMVATHNQKSCMHLANLMDKNNIPRNDPKIYFAQLYGMSDNLSYNLAEAGFNTVKYVPYGAVKTMMPYLLRRAQENTSVKGQSSRELQLIEKVLQRRKALK